VRLSGNTIDVDALAGGASAHGGAIYALGSPLTFEKTTVDGNRVDAQGTAGGSAEAGGLHVASAPLSVVASTISRNVASSSHGASAGGLWVNGGANPATLTNSTVAGNRIAGASEAGGGIWVVSSLLLKSSTVARNEASQAGGIWVGGGVTTLRGSVLAQNAAGSARDCFGPVGSTGYNLVGTTAGCTFTHMASDKRNLAAKLGLLGSNGGPTQTIPLLAGSPALDAIPKAQCPTARDQRGVKRPQGPRCDIGAYERRT
jgi:hypothetical protein